MKIVLLIGPSSAGKSTLSEELHTSHQWVVVAGDVVREQIRANAGDALKRELIAETLVERLKSYMKEDELVRFCQSGLLNISKDGHSIENYRVSDVNLTGIEEVLSNAGFPKEEVTSLAKMLREVGQVHVRYFSSERLEDAMLDEAFSGKHGKDPSIIIDTVPEGAERLIEKLNKRAEQYRKEHSEQLLDTSVVLAHIPPQKLSERVQRRNKEAEENKNPQNKREGMFPFHQLGDVLTAKDTLTSSQIMATISNQELLKIAYRHNPYKPHEKKSFQRAGRAAVEYARLSKKMGMPKDKTAQVDLAVRGALKFDAVIDMTEGDPKKLAGQLLTAIENKDLIALMDKAGVPGVSIATLNNDGSITPTVLGATDTTKTASTVTPETVFGAASLSKPVFAHLVLEIIKNSNGRFTLDSKLNEFFPFEEFCNKEGNKYKWDGAHKDWIENMTVGMALSHTTGFNVSRNNEVELFFKPGEEYAYSNFGLFYLQNVVERYTNRSLQELAKEYVFDKIGMKHSTFYQEYKIEDMPKDKDYQYQPGVIYLKKADSGLEYRVIDINGKLNGSIIPWDKLPENFPRGVVLDKEAYKNDILNYTARQGHTTLPAAVAVFSLYTTANDYALFVKELMKLRKQDDKTISSAFEPHVFMTTDRWAKEFGIDQKHLERLASGFTWELETDEKGKTLKAYKTGDMNQWRAWVAMDFEKNTAIVFFANSENGHMLADAIVQPVVKLEHAPDFFFQKWGFAKKIEPNWKEKENERITEIVKYENDFTRRSSDDAKKTEITQAHPSPLSDPKSLKLKH